MKGISNVKQFLVHHSGCSFAKFGTVGSFILSASENESSKLYVIEQEVSAHLFNFTNLKICVMSYDLSN